MATRPSDEQLRRFHGQRLDVREMDELIGLARGICADGLINQEEAEYLQKWLVASADVRDNPVIGPLLVRVNDMLVDRKLDAEEATELMECLQAFSGSDFELGEPLKATTLPLDDPAPPVVFAGNRFCFTGTFVYGTRSECETITTERGATYGSLTKQTDFLVIGTYVTDSWLHSSYGRKIMRASEMREQGVPVCIVDETRWRSYLTGEDD